MPLCKGGAGAWGFLDLREVFSSVSAKSLGAVLTNCSNFGI
jgi:hypothetical protein